MKVFLFLLPSIFLFSTIALAQEHADLEVVRCRKKIRFSQSAYNWVEVSRLDSGSSIFQSGKGIDTQMLEVWFEAIVDEVQLTPTTNSSQPRALRVWKAEDEFMLLEAQQFKVKNQLQLSVQVFNKMTQKVQKQSGYICL